MSEDTLLATLLDQERRLQFDHFDNDVAFAVGMALVTRGRDAKLPITVDVTRTQQQLFHVALTGTSADNDHWVRRKNAVVYRFGHSSFYIGTQCRQRGKSMEEMFLVDPRHFAAHGGAFPVIVKSAGLIGTITVSGLPQEEDHRMVVEAIDGYLTGTRKAS